MVAEGVRTTEALALGAAAASSCRSPAGRGAARRTKGRAHRPVRAHAAPAACGGRIIEVGFFDRLVQGLNRTKEQIVERFDEIVQKADSEPDRTRPIDVDTVEALEELLISADVGIAATEQIVTAVRDRARRGESLRELVKAQIRAIFDEAGNGPPPNGHTPHVTLIVGVNGTGKTTTVSSRAI